MQLETLKVKNPAEDGGFMIINKSDFDDSVHELFDAESQSTAPTRAGLDEVLATLPADYTDTEYVVNSLRRHYGDLFTADDEAKVRELLPKKLADMTATELKVVLDERKIEYRGNASKADLLALLEAAPKG